MKKYAFLLAVFLLIVLLPGCAKNTADDVLLTEPEETLLQAFDAYSLFEISPLDSDSADRKEAGGIPYARVTDNRFPKLSDFETYLKKIFSDKIVQDLLSRNMYKDFDGHLYAAEAGRGTNILVGNVTYETTKKTPESILYTAKVDLLDSPGGDITATKDYTFVYEKLDGNWVFTTFEYFW